ncbi:MAG: hypothetical protein HYX47_01500 [Burkholderiales bacterium]|nr:hypothetical protein [Burkholderiales bacterium]
MAHPAHLSPAFTGPRASNINYFGAARARRKFELYYPAGFDDPVYQVAERSVKERAHLEWESELSPLAYRRMLARGEHSRIVDAVLRIEQRSSLLFSFEKMALRDAVGTAAGGRLFAVALYAFLYGRGSPQNKFDAWLGALSSLPRRQARVLSWPLVTVFGQIARPDTHLFFKPTVTRKAARAYGFDLDYEAAPSWPAYRALQTFAAIIRRDLDRKPGFRAQDMIDIQSFIWVQGSAEYEP